MTIGFLIIGRGRKLNAEEQAALDWLSSQKRHRLKLLSFQDLAANRNTLRGIDVLWWHNASTPQLPAIAKRARVLDLLRAYLERGGGLLLSLLAAQHIVDLRLESQRPNVVIAGRWNEDPWIQTWHGMKGFHSWNLLDISGHPIFDGLFGGVYTWSPKKGEKYWKVDYAGDIVPADGQVVAVGRDLISIEERSRLILEYTLGKGSVLTIGSFLFFGAKRNFYREHLERFTLNCLEYLGRRLPAGRSIRRGVDRRSHQDESSRGRKSKMRPSHWSLERRKTVYFRCNRPGLQVVHKPLPSTQSGLELKRIHPSSSFTDLGGRRVLVTAEERGGLTEVWSHPVRLLQDLDVGFLIDGGSVVWSKDVPSTFTARPEALIREYKIDETTKIRETVFSALHDPGAALHYEVETTKNIELVFTFTVDLRPMWPKSEHAIGSLFYAWDDGLHGAIVEDKTRTFCAVFGGGVEPEEYLIGQFDTLKFKNGRLRGHPTDDVRIGVGVRYALNGPSFTFAIAGGMEQSDRTFALYKRLLQRSPSFYREQIRYYKILLDRSMIVQTPDEQFNEAYRWALVGTDRFFTRTPLLGESLMAGYSSTTPGWGSGRPGYGWYFGRDAVWTAFAMLAYGDFEKVKSVLQFLGRYQEFTGKIFHEATTSGTVHYDASDSTPLYLILMGYYLRTTGDVSFVRKQWKQIARAVQFCDSTDTDGDGLIEATNVGHGWVEGGNLFGAHVEVYLAAVWCEALRQVAYVAKNLRKAKLAGVWERRASAVRRIVENRFWNPKTGWYNFGMFRDRTFNAEKTVMPAVACCFRLLEGSRAEPMLKELAGEQFTAPWGVRMVGKDSKLYNPKSYHGGSIWPLFTGWTSLAEYRYGLSEQGFKHLCMNLFVYKDFALGYLPEVLHGEEYRPVGVCLHQAWSQSMAIQPLLEGMIGLEVDAAKGVVKLDPQLPESWKRVSIRNVRVGKLKLHLKLEQKSGALHLTVRGPGKSVRMKFIRLRGVTDHFRVPQRYGKASDTRSHQ